MSCLHCYHKEHQSICPEDECRCIDITELKGGWRELHNLWGKSLAK